MSCRHIKRLLAGMLLFAAPAVAAEPNALNEDQIKAGFVFNFLRFVEWPGKSYANPTSPIVLCVVGSSPVAAFLSDAAAGKVINGRAVSVARKKATEDFSECHLVFIASAEERSDRRIIAGLKSSSVLTVGEVAGFTQAGGVINFFTQDNRVKLEINLEAAARANLRISAKLIAVSRVISSAPNTGGN